MEALRERGTTIRVEICDLADSAALDGLIARLPPLAGIVHAAGILEDVTLARARPEQFAAVLAPKFDAALRFDAAFPDLDFFVLYSSAVGLFGQFGQAMHVAASLALDALAQVRRRRGVHAVSLGWGPWRDIGLAADRHELIRQMAAQGLGTIPNDAGEAVLDWALATPAAAVAVLPVDRARFLASFGAARPPAALRNWRPPAVRRPALPSAPMPAGGQSLNDVIAAEAEAVLGYPPGHAIDRRANLFELELNLADGGRATQSAADAPARTEFEFNGGVRAQQCRSASHPSRRRRADAGDADRGAAGSPIAIVGTGCRFPAGGSDPACFWKSLAEGRDGIVDETDRPETALGNGVARPGGYLSNIAAFDPTFFGISPREADFMDPQHRLLLEVSGRRWRMRWSRPTGWPAPKPASSSVCAITIMHNSPPPRIGLTAMREPAASRAWRPVG